MILNKNLRIKIAKIVKSSGEGHIPSCFSIVDVINFLYENILTFKSNQPKWPDRDYFILSKGHGAGALFTVLEKNNFITESVLNSYGFKGSILGGHPDSTKVPGAEASTGSLGHGFPTSIGIALGLKIKHKKNKVICLIGDGECHEGTIWESANIGNNLGLGNLCVIVDWNGSAAQLMPHDDMPAKWRAFGWEVHVIDGHSAEEMQATFAKLNFSSDGRPNVVIARTIKGKGVSFTEGHGPWHHRVPSDEEMLLISQELST
jgi:transketolase